MDGRPQQKQPRLNQRDCGQDGEATMSQTPEDAKSQTPEERSGKWMSPTQDVGSGTESRCPKCGGTPRRPWIAVCVCAFAGFFIFLVMAPTGLAMQSIPGGIVCLASAGLAVISLIAIPITGALAVASRSRCSACGHRFMPGDPSPHMNSSRFPVRLGLISSAFLLVLLGTGAALILTAPGWGVMDTALMLIGRLIMAGLAFGTGLLIQALLWRHLRTRGANVTRLLTAFALPVAMIGVAWLLLASHDRATLLRRYDPLVWAPNVLARLDLAPLPPSARHIRVDIRRVLFCAEEFLRFEADPDVIEQFLADSANLKKTLRDWDQPRTRTTSYYNSSSPSWYDQPLSGRWRCYDVNMPGNIGEVIVDDEKHAVYVYWGK
jgi:hypothetical protein